MRLDDGGVAFGAGDSGTASIRALLKAATASLHDAVDSRFSVLLAAGEAGYVSFLTASATAIYPLEQALAASNVVAILPDWGERTRTSALRADIAALDAADPPTEPLPPLGSEAFQFGAVYVLEGSRLGARVLMRRMQAGVRVRAATRYLRHGEGKPLWGTFLDRLELSRAVRRAPGEAIAGARAAFALFAAASAACANLPPHCPSR